MEEIKRELGTYLYNHIQNTQKILILNIKSFEINMLIKLNGKSYFGLVEEITEFYQTLKEYKTQLEYNYKTASKYFAHEVKNEMPIIKNRIVLVDNNLNYGYITTRKVDKNLSETEETEELKKVKNIRRDIEQFNTFTQYISHINSFFTLMDYNKPEEPAYIINGLINIIKKLQKTIKYFCEEIKELYINEYENDIKNDPYFMDNKDAFEYRLKKIEEILNNDD